MTLVAYYGKKPPPIEALIRPLQEEMVRLLGSAFVAYDLYQVHGTVIGLEGLRQGSDVLNLNYRELRKEDRSMHFAKVLAFIEETSRLPFDVQIGGFSPEVSYPFTSRGEHPYFRSFSLQDPIAVAMGWPVNGRRYPRSLDALRRSLNDYNVLHKYHRTNNDVDNDFFFVLGRVERSMVRESQVQDTQEAMREKLAAMEPLLVPISRDVLSLVNYEDPQFPLRSTTSMTLVEASAALAKIIPSYPSEST